MVRVVSIKHIPGGLEIPNPEVKYIRIKGSVVTLKRNTDGYWTDGNGTLYAFCELGKDEDQLTRCGVAPFALPTWDCFRQVNEACGTHDYAYSSPVYQAFHSREEADDELRKRLGAAGYPILGYIFHGIVRIFGSRWWENKR